MGILDGTGNDKYRNSLKTLLKRDTMGAAGFMRRCVREKLHNSKCGASDIWLLWRRVEEIESAYERETQRVQQLSPQELCSYILENEWLSDSKPGDDAKYRLGIKTLLNSEVPAAVQACRACAAGLRALEYHVADRDKLIERAEKLPSVLEEKGGDLISKAEKRCREALRKRAEAERRQADAEQRCTNAILVQEEAEQQRDAAKLAQAEAEQQRDAAKLTQAEAEQQRDEAKQAQVEAEQQRDAAKLAQSEAEQQRDEAKQEQAKAEQQRDKAKQELAEAERKLEILKPLISIIDELKKLSKREIYGVGVLLLVGGISILSLLLLVLWCRRSTSKG